MEREGLIKWSWGLGSSTEGLRMTRLQRYTFTSNKEPFILALSLTPFLLPNFIASLSLKSLIFPLPLYKHNCHIAKMSYLSPPETQQSDITVHNLCGRFELSIDHIDLVLLSTKLSNATYNRKRLPAVVIRKLKPKATVLLFKTGRGLIIGLDHFQALEPIAKKLAKEISCLLNIKKIQVVNCRITNILAVSSLGFKVDLGKLCEHRCASKHQNMPGVIYRLDEPLKNVIVHHSGKMVFLGAKCMEDLERADLLMRREMKGFEFLQKTEWGESLEDTIG